jgi:hypothetical protein
MQNIELEKLGLMAMPHEECEQVIGGTGGWVSWLFQQAIIHSEEIARGIEKGWNY